MAKVARPKVMVAKVGLDGHTRGAKLVTMALRDAGIEVIYTGARCTPEEVINIALQEDVDLIGISSLSGAHMEICSRILSLRRELNMNQIIVVGGIIPQEDAEELKQSGVAAVFNPNDRLDYIAQIIKDMIINQKRTS